MVRELLNKIDTKFDYTNEKDSDKKQLAKAMAGGFLEGVLDGLVFNGVLLLGLGLFAAIQNHNNK